ncbi:Aste57867_22501 [Aphanomyces stellatus]|uniref:Aste57867_22501 protein n=1 Tax=Aphanomyces stellatus TaxID=120398 RepID=A0A485LQ54_9STRA|nr:hypothetical protein As57867_022431 [Aphanomyces stellatus]VFT99161.1 Aste57867_22501 [Aphanomyces stellatus]
MAASRPMLHSFWRSSCSWRVRTALALKGIDYDYRAVNPIRKENESEAYRRVNKSMKVPSLEIDGLVLNQSSAILEYLEETRPNPPLLPSAPGDRAVVRALCDMIGADIQPLQNVVVLRKVIGGLPKDEKDAAKEEWVDFWVSRGFQGLEARLAETAGTYCFGDTITMADLYLAPQVLNAQGYHVDLAPFPTIQRINETLSNEAAFIHAHPKNMPDAPVQP